LYFTHSFEIGKWLENSSEFSIALGAFPCERRVQKAAVGVDGRGVPVSAAPTSRVPLFQPAEYPLFWHVQFSCWLHS